MVTEPLTPFWALFTLPLMNCVLPVAPLFTGLVSPPISDDAPPAWPSAFPVVLDRSPSLTLLALWPLSL